MNTNFSFKKNKIIFLFALLPIAVVIFQTGRFWDLYDSSYILEHSYMIAAGKIPYKDFILHTTPGTYIIQAFIIKIIGFTLYSQIAYCCIVSILTLLVTYRILFFFNNDKWLNVAIALPIAITGGYGICTAPFYDPDCVFFMLISILLILSCQQKSFPLLYMLIAGFCAFVPAFFKQNIGLVYLVMIHFVLLITLFNKKSGLIFKKYLWFLSGTIIAVILFVVYISITSGFERFFFCVFSYGYSHRLNGIMDFIGQNFTLIVLRNTVIWLLIIISIKYLKIKNIFLGLIVFILALTPFYFIPVFRLVFRQLPYYNQFLTILPATIIICTIAAVYAFIRLKDVPLLIRLIPFAVLASIGATFLSHSYWGSHYGIWPMFSILFSFLFMVLSNSLFKNSVNLLKKLFATNSVLITVSMAMFINSNYIFSHLPGYEIKEKVYSSKTENLRGMSLPGELIPNMDNFFRFVKDEIPFEDPVIIMPYEDPFYLATGRYPHFPLLIHDFALSVYTIDEIAEKVNSYNVKWMVIKTGLQAPVMGDTESSWKNLDKLISLLKKNFLLYKKIPGYEIYKKI